MVSYKSSKEYSLAYPHIQEPLKYIIITPPSKTKPNAVEERKNSLLQFGASIRDFFEKIEERVVFVVSGDLSHTHPTNCKIPLYLPNPLWNLPQLKEESSLFDSLIEKWANTKDEEVLLEKAIEVDKVALSCGLQGIIILHGTLKEDLQTWRSKVFVNIAPTYFGMIVCLFTKSKTS